MSAQNELNSLKDFLSSSSDISTEDKKYAFDFFNKFYYVKELNGAVINEIVDRTSLGFGNYNSKIMIAIRSETFHNGVLKVIEPMITKMNISLYNIYITMIDKVYPTFTPLTYTNHDAATINEINAIGPQILYVIDSDEEFVRTIEKAKVSLPRLNNIIIKYISLNDVLSVGNEENKSDPYWLDKRNSIWLSLRAMMNFKDKEILE